MSFLVAFNGQFSPLTQNIQKISGGVSEIKSIRDIPGVSEFKDHLRSLDEDRPPRPHPKMEAYKKHVTSYQQGKKHEHAKDIMSSPVKVISENASATEASEIMAKCGFRHLPVVNDHNLIVGMISDRELLNSSENKRCREIMAQKVIVSDEFTSLNEIAITLLRERINALPIVDRKHEVTGIITLTDILNYVIKSTGLLSSG